MSIAKKTGLLGLRESLQAPLAFRLSAALAASVALHLALMLGVGARPASPAGGRWAIRAHLIPASASVVALPSAPSDAKSPIEAPEAEPVAPPTPQPEETAQAPPPPPGGVPFIGDPTYYPARQLDVYPRALERVEPAYPEQAAQRNQSGVVTLLLLINELGSVDDVSVLSAEPEDLFEASAIAAFRQARFTPGEKDGRKVKSRLVVRVNYDLDPVDPGGPESRRSPILSPSPGRLP